jgi:anaerobic selenocysteine-containing dehydrogenase
VVALSGGETVEQATALARLAQNGLGSRTALLPETFHPALDRFRAPLSAIREADVCLVVGDHPVIERAPIVDLWLRGARRRGAEVITVNPAGTIAAPPGAAASVCAALAAAEPPKELRAAARSLKRGQRVALVWSEDDPSGGAHIAALAESLGEKVSVYFLPRTPNGRGVASAWGRTEDPPRDGEIGALIVSGDEAASDPRVRALAERARFVLTTAMFENEVTLWSHVVLPGTSYLERDGTTVNLEGRPQRLRRAVIPPTDDELAFFAELAGRFDVQVDAWATAAPADLAPLPARAEAAGSVKAPRARANGRRGRGLELVRYRGLFSGPAVERVPELQFQRPLAEVEIAAADALERGIERGDAVRVSSNGTSRTLTARVNRRLRAGVVRIEDEHAEGLAGRVEVTRA